VKPLAITLDTPPPLLLDCNSTVKKFESTAPALGLFDDADSQAQSLDFRIGVGCRLVIYSDGITETRDRHSRMYDIDQLVEDLSCADETTSAGIVRALLRKAENWRGKDVPLDDDITLLALSRYPSK